MKFSSAIAGKVTMVMSLDDVAPPHGFLTSHVISAIQGTFSMTGSGISPEQALMIQAQGGVVPPTLQNGLLMSDQDRIAIRKVEFSPDGSIIAASASNTDDALAVIAGIENILEDFGFSKIQKHRKLYYGSTACVEFEDNFTKKIALIQKLTKAVSSSLESEGLLFTPVEFQKFVIGPNPGITPVQLNLFVAPFTLEQRIGVGPEPGRWFSEASLPTTKHLELLHSIESILGEAA